jgi:hypothetical protein
VCNTSYQRPAARLTALLTHEGTPSCSFEPLGTIKNKMNYQQKNELLFTEYQRYLGHLLTTFDSEIKQELSLPLFMYVYPEYDHTSKKTMVVGKETKKWYSTLADNTQSTERIIEHYKEFELGVDYYNSPFWRFSKTLFNRLNPTNAPNGLLWTNLSKIDQNGAGVSQEVREKNKAGYELLVSEIGITAPDVIVFLTSWAEDEYLKRTFGELSFEKVEDIDFNYLVRLRNDKLPFNTFRTYHPRFLNDSTRSKYTIDEMIEKIIKNCA